MSETSTTNPDGLSERFFRSSGGAYSGGERIGNYIIREALGEGGFGIVYRAEQTAPIQRQVALKVIKPGMDSHAVIARFEQERQALAVMDHKHIAKVFDAGLTHDRRPYFVMEFVKGESITEFCDRHKMTIRQRLRLFLGVCDAVQHAHMKGIIHRDLKPANILVAYDADGEPTIKVIDFGVAKALNQRLSERTICTEQGQVIGTPEYMSPEQAEMSGLDIDTRSDIYSLGVVLYGLLAGLPPFEPTALRSSPFNEIQRIIREQNPPKPSTRVSSAGEAAAAFARKRATDPRLLAGSLRGELDWVVMKCLEKDRTRRYDTANALGMEIRRHLNDEPVLARPPSARYRLSKFISRRRGPVAAGAAIVLLLVGGLIGTSTFALRARAAEADANRRADELQQAADFLESRLSSIDAHRVGLGVRDSLFGQRRQLVESTGQGDGDIQTALADLEHATAGVNFTTIALDALRGEFFERSLEAVERDFGDQPQLQARLLQAMGNSLREIGLLHMAEDPLQRALNIRRQELGEQHPQTLATVGDLAYLHRQNGDYKTAERLYTETVNGLRRTLGDEHPETLKRTRELGAVYWYMGRYRQAGTLFREALAGFRRVYGDEHPATVAAMDSLAWSLGRENRYDEANALLRSVLAGRRRLLGDEHPKTLVSMRNLGGGLVWRTSFPEAEALLRESLAGMSQRLGADHPQTIRATGALGWLYLTRGHLAQAERFTREAFGKSRRLHGANHRLTIVYGRNRAVALKELGRFGEAESLMRESLERALRTLGRSHPQTLYTMNNFGTFLEHMGRLSEAEALLRKTLGQMESALGLNNEDTIFCMSNLGRTLLRRGRLSEAETLLREALERSRRALPNQNTETIDTSELLGRSLRAQGRFEEAAPLLKSAMDVRLQRYGESSWYTVVSISRYGALQRDLGNLDEALRLGAMAVDLGRAQEVRSWRFAMCLSEYASTLAAVERFEEAEKLALEAHGTLEEVFGSEDLRTRRVAEQLATLYSAWDDAEPHGGYGAKEAVWRSPSPSAPGMP